MNSTVSQSSVYLVQDGEGGLGVPVGGVGHPATRLEKNDLKHSWLHESNGKKSCSKKLSKEVMMFMFNVKLS